MLPGAAINAIKPSRSVVLRRSAVRAVRSGRSAAASIATYDQARARTLTTSSKAVQQTDRVRLPVSYSDVLI